MKIAFCIFRYFPFGGLQQDMLRIATACLAHGHQLTVFTMDWQGENELALPVQQIKVTALSNHQRAKQFAQQLAEQLRDYDFVLGFNKMPGLDAYFAGDVCFKFHKKSKGFLYRFSARYRTYVALEAAVFSAQQSMPVFLLTEKQQQEYCLSYKTPEKRFHLIPPGIDKNELSAVEMLKVREELRESLAVDPSVTVLLFIASDFYNKGLDRVLAAMAHTRDPHFVLWVIGGDDPKEYLAMQKQYRLDGQVQFFGAMEDVKPYMLAADMLVNPARVESAGMSIVQALTMGLPVILTNNCGYAMHVKEADAGLILPEQLELNDLSVAITDSRDQEKRDQWRQNALAYSQQADLYSMGEKVVHLIEGFSR